MKKDKKILVTIAIALFLVFASFIYFKKPTKINNTSKPEPVKSFSIVLNEQNSSGESGLATFAEKEGKTLVTIKVVNELLDVPQSARLDKGTCAEPISELFNIENVVNGESETLIDISLKELLMKTPFVLILHKSIQEDAIYTSCGYIDSIK